MVSVGVIVRAFPPFSPCNSSSIPDKPQAFSFPIKSSLTHLFFSSKTLTHFPISNLFAKYRNGSSLSAIKSPKKSSEVVLDLEDLDINYDYEDEEEEDDDDDDDFDDYEEEEEDDDEDMIVPIRNMKKWLANKPAGFGAGKEYDTSIEDKLAEEMEQSRLAQLANIKKLKNNPQIANSKKEKQNVSEVVPSGIPVRLVNLPKKKNIHRDLQKAFKGVQGIISIVPVVSGNKKTREPICKGIAFAYFKSKDEANRFIQIFSKQIIAFGKIQKQIKYEMINPSTPKPVGLKSDSIHAHQIAETSVDDDLDAASDLENPIYISSEELVFREHDSEDEEHVSTFSILKEQPLADSPSPKQQQKGGVKKKKLMAKKQGGKYSKLNSLGSANRLKVKEKSVLTDVFSKYGSKVGMSVKEQS